MARESARADGRGVIPDAGHSVAAGRAPAHTPVHVVLIGPECSGKTTLAIALAAHFGASWTPEAARLFAESATEPLSGATVEPIAKLSMRLDDEARATLPSPALLVHDTDLLSTVVYARHYYGSVAPWIEREARARLGDLYLFCAPDLPWTADGVRDRPTERASMYEEFRTALTEFGARTVVISGALDARMRTATAAVGALIAAESPPKSE